jgi:hypothetical protein
MKGTSLRVDTPDEAHLTVTRCHFLRNMGPGIAEGVIGMVDGWLGACMNARLHECVIA